MTWAKPDQSCVSWSRRRTSLLALFGVLLGLFSVTTATAQTSSSKPGYVEERTPSGSGFGKLSEPLPDMPPSSPTTRSKAQPAKPSMERDRVRALGCTRASATGGIPTSYCAFLLRNNVLLLRADELVRSNQFRILKRGVREPLESDYGNRVQERDAMLPEGDWLDESFARLMPRRQRLNAIKKDLDSEIADYQRKVASHNSQCAPARDEQTYRWCLEDSKGIRSWREDLNKRSAALNAENNELTPLTREHDRRTDAFAKRYNEWAVQVQDLVQRIEAALSSSTGDCTDAQHQTLQDAVNKACKLESRACRSGQSCEELRANLKKNQICYDARKEVMDVCYRGGDPEHQQALAETQNAINTCVDLIRRRCGIGAASPTR